MVINDENQLKNYRDAAKISTEILHEIYKATKEGVSPADLNKLSENLCKLHQVKPAFVGVSNSHKHPYQHAMCISVNDTVVHGIPTDTPLKDGDLVKLDFGIIYQGLCTDQCVTVGVGKVAKKDRKLLSVARDSVLQAVKLAKAGNTTGLLGHTMESLTKKHGFKVLHDYIGHGIGHNLHESPPIPAFGHFLSGDVLKPGMVLCIESQVVAGDNKVYTATDGWSVKTKDGKKSAMFEFMVVVGKDKPEILTKTYDWSLTC